MERMDTSKRPVRPLLLASITSRPGARMYAPGYQGNYRWTGSGLAGMGFDLSTANELNPEPISHAAISIIDTISNFFHIGSGRREADLIVPYQNEFVTKIIAPVAAAVNSPNKDQMSCETLDKILSALLTAKAQWLHFLHDTEWSDGRAATQAEQTLQVYWDDQERKTRALMQVCSHDISDILTGGEDIPGLDPVTDLPGGGGTTPGYTPPYTGTAPPLAAGLSGNNMLLMGVGVLALYMYSRKGK